MLFRIIIFRKSFPGNRETDCIFAVSKPISGILHGIPRFCSKKQAGESLLSADFMISQTSRPSRGGS